MAVKSKTVFVCSECGYESPKWIGKCAGCGAWNTMTEDVRLAQSCFRLGKADSYLQRTAVVEDKRFR